jgi:hypothetical protein
VSDDVPQGTAGDEPEEIRTRRRAALAQQLHAVIRHAQPARRGDSIERAICVIDELARAARITARVWSDAISSSLAIGASRDSTRRR